MITKIHNIIHDNDLNNILEDHQKLSKIIKSAVSFMTNYPK